MDEPTVIPLRLKKEINHKMAEIAEAESRRVGYTISTAAIYRRAVDEFIESYFKKNKK